MLVYQIYTLYTLNLHNVVCQLYLNKAEEKKSALKNYLINQHLIKFV